MALGEFQQIQTIESTIVIGSTRFYGFLKRRRVDLQRPGAERPCEVTIAKHQGMYGQDGDDEGELLRSFPLQIAKILGENFPKAKIFRNNFLKDNF